MEILGRRAWWMPSWMDRLVPHLAVEHAPDVTDTVDERVAEPV